MLPSYIRVRAVVWAYGRGQTDTQTYTQTRVTTIHFASSTTHAKCNHVLLPCVGLLIAYLLFAILKHSLYTYTHSPYLFIDARVYILCLDKWQLRQMTCIFEYFLHLASISVSASSCWPLPWPPASGLV